MAFFSSSGACSHARLFTWTSGMGFMVIWACFVMFWPLDPRRYADFFLVFQCVLCFYPSNFGTGMNGWFDLIDGWDGWRFTSQFTHLLKVELFVVSYLWPSCFLHTLFTFFNANVALIVQLLSSLGSRMESYRKDLNVRTTCRGKQLLFFNLIWKIFRPSYFHIKSCSLWTFFG